MRNITASSLILDTNEFDEIVLPKNQADRYTVKKEDILIARSGSPGATRIIVNPEGNVIFCGFIICCTPHASNHRIYLAHFFKKLEGTNATKTGGSILQNVSQDTLKSLNICLPNDELLSSFNEKIVPLIKLMQTIINENRELTKLRDWLLPMLMNGQVTIADPTPSAHILEFNNQEYEQYDVRQAARSYGEKTTDDTSNLVKEFIKRRKNDSKS